MNRNEKVVDLDAHRRNKDRANRKKGSSLGRHLVEMGALAGVVAVAWVGGEKAVRVIQHQNAENGTALAAERAKNDTDYQIPSVNEPHRVLVFGSTYEDREGNKYTLVGLDSAAGYVHAMNPEISFGDARDLIMAENVQYQKDSGKEIKPLDVDAGQGTRLPVEFGAGELVEPQSSQSTSSAG